MNTTIVDNSGTEAVLFAPPARRVTIDEWLADSAHIEETIQTVIRRWKLSSFIHYAGVIDKNGDMPNCVVTVCVEFSPLVLVGMGLWHKRFLKDLKEEFVRAGIGFCHTVTNLF